MIRLYCMKAQLRAGKTHGWLLCLLPASLQIERSVESIAERLVTKEVAFLYLFISTCEDRLGGVIRREEEKSFGPDRCHTPSGRPHKPSLQHTYYISV